MDCHYFTDEPSAREFADRFNGVSVTATVSQLPSGVYMVIVREWSVE